VTVFSNTTPFLALSSTDRLSLLPRLFTTVHVAESVARECARGGPIKVPDLRGLEWVQILPEPQQHHPGLWMLDAGERDTLELALERHAKLVIIDERIGRNVAEYLGLRITGTLGVLLKARQRGFLASFRDEVEAMRQAGIHYHPRLIDRLAPLVGE
jgi:uncharacterized protein